MTPPEFPVLPSDQRATISRHQAEDRNRDFLELTLSGINEAVLVIQEDRIRYFNRKALDLAGYTNADTYLDKSFIEFVAPGYRQLVLDRHRRRTRGENVPSTYPLQILHRQGHPVWLQLSAMRIEWQDRPATLAFLSDISEQKRMESLLQQAKEDWENTFNTIDEAILTILPDHTVTQANKAASVLFARPLASILNKKCYELFHGSDQPPADCPCFTVLRTGQTSTVEVMEPHLGKFIALKHFPKTDKDGQLIGVVQVAADISAVKTAVSEQQALQGQLIQAQKMESIGTLAGGIAHDFNNLLTVILGYSELAKSELGDGHPVRDHLTEVLTAGTRAKNLVRQILTFSRKTSEDRKPLELTPLIKETISLLRASLPKTISIRSNIAADCGLILAEPVQMHQIMMNLCTNAFHAMKSSGGLLEITLEPVLFETSRDVGGVRLKEDSYLALTVRDSGHGMPPEIVKRIFEPYFSTKPVGEGTGLGLSVVHGIVRSHGGSITVESEPGQGTTFRIYLPRLTTPLGQKKESIPEAMPGTGRILLVDDEPSLAALGQKMLSRLGYHVTASATSVQALQQFIDHPDGFDLVITDLTMPHMTGLELARKIRSLRPSTPIILTTGNREAVSPELMRKIGIRSCLGKPFLSAEISSAVKEALQ